MKLRRNLISLIIILFISSLTFYLLYQPEPESLKSARKAYELKDWRAAFNDSARRLRENPEDRRAKVLMARSAARIQRDQVAMELYDNLSGSADAEDLYLVGTILFRRGRIQDGEKMFRRSLEIDPEYHESAKFLSQFLFQNRRYEDALANAEKWRLFEPERDEAEIFKARIFEAINYPDKASASLQLVIGQKQNSDRNNQSTESLRIMLARNLLKLAKAGDALTILNQIDIKNIDAEALWLKSRANLQLGNFNVALELFNDSKTKGISAQLNQAEEPSPFAGALSCRECHSEIYDEQQNSRHSKTFRHGNQAAELTLSNFRQSDPGASEITAEFQSEQKLMQFHFSSQRQDLKPIIKYIMGSGRHAVTPLLSLEDQNVLYECRWTYYASVNQWDLTPGQPAVPPQDIGFIGTGQTADMLRLCLNCHTTNPTAILESKGPESIDRAIGCEKCHGPGANHINAIKLKFPDKAIGRFRRNSSGTRPQVMLMCSECHGTAGREIPEAFDAGTVRFQSTTLTFSECYKKSSADRAFDCLSCHSPHQDVETNSNFYNAKCLTCHIESTKPAEAESKIAICSVNSKSDCISCHMPKIQSVQKHTKFTDHYIRKPRKEGP